MGEGGREGGRKGGRKGGREGMKGWKSMYLVLSVLKHSLISGSVFLLLNIYNNIN